MQVENIVIVNDFNFVQGGASQVAIDTARLLKENTNKKIYFFSAVNKKDDEIEGIEYICTEQKEALKEKNKIKGIINGIYNLKAKKKFKSLLKTLNKENTVIHVHGWTKALSSSIFDVAFKMKFKVVLTLHDYFLACPNGGFFDYNQNTICKKNPLSKECIKCNCDSRNYGFKLYRIIRQFVQNKIVKLNSKLEYAIGISDLNIDILSNFLDSPKMYLKKIYNPINITLNQGESKINWKNNKYFLYVGRISKEKGVDIFCKAVTETDVKGIVVGDGSEREKLEKMYSNIEFVGWKCKEEVKRYMSNAKCLIFPSLWYETAGLTVLEIQSLGIPAIVSSVCAAIEFTNKDLIFDINNIESLKEKIIHINEMDLKINKMCFGNYIDEILNIYEV